MLLIGWRTRQPRHGWRDDGDDAITSGACANASPRSSAATATVTTPDVDAHESSFRVSPSQRYELSDHDRTIAVLSSSPPPDERSTENRSGTADATARTTICSGPRMRRSDKRVVVLLRELLGSGSSQASGGARRSSPLRSRRLLRTTPVARSLGVLLDPTAVSGGGERRPLRAPRERRQDPRGQGGRASTAWRTKRAHELDVTQSWPRLHHTCARHHPDT